MPQKESLIVKLTATAEQHERRAEYEASRPYDGAGERPEQIAAYWRARANATRHLLAAAQRDESSR